MLAFSNDYYGLIFRATQSVELFCAYFAEQDKPETVTEFHEDIWYMLLDYVMVYDKENIRFTVKNVTEI